MNLGEKFAQHIDRGEFDLAGEMISDDCIYKAGDTEHQGRRGIIAMYRDLQQSMKPHFDEYRKGDRTHRMRTEEILRFKDGLIVNIEQISNRGEAEAFRKFWQEIRG